MPEGVHPGAFWPCMSGAGTVAPAESASAVLCSSLRAALRPWSGFGPIRGGLDLQSGLFQLGSQLEQPLLYRQFASTRRLLPALGGLVAELLSFLV